MHGSGTFRYADGSVYEGEWKDGKRHGTGTCQYVDGNVYEGEWKDGKPHGRGRLRYADRTVYEGVWADGQLQSHSPNLSAPDAIVAASRLPTTPAQSRSTGGRTLLNKFQRTFKVDESFINDLHSQLVQPRSKLFLVFVDLDNVPNFFVKIKKEELNKLPFEIFIVCSANHRRCPLSSGRNVHFSLAACTKDSADAVCTVAAAYLDNIVTLYGRQGSVPFVFVSNDQIFQQVTKLLCAGGTRSTNVSRDQASRGIQMLRDIIGGSIGSAGRGGARVGGGSWECSVCRKEFASERSLDQHCDATGHYRCWECEVCGREFSSERALEQHCDAKGH